MCTTYLIILQGDFSHILFTKKNCRNDLKKLFSVLHTRNFFSESFLIFLVHFKNIFDSEI